MNTSVEALLLSTDPQSVSVVDRLFTESTITCKSFSTGGDAIEALKEKDFDLLTIDFDEPGASTVMDAWTGRGPNTSKVIIAFARQGEMLRLAQQRSAHFAVQKPLDRRLMTKTIKMAHDIILKRRRADYRYSVNIKTDAIMVGEDGIERKLRNVLVLDISQGGLCLKADAVVSKKAIISLSFNLPQTQHLLHITGKLTWVEPGGVVGVKFSSISAPDTKRLQNWLDARIPSKTTTIENRPQGRRMHDSPDLHV